jgi:hypothetical protein
VSTDEFQDPRKDEAGGIKITDGLGRPVRADTARRYPPTPSMTMPNSEENHRAILSVMAFITKR